MIAPLASLLIAQAFTPLPRVDGFRIAELDYRLGMATCTEYYHVARCPSARRLVRDLACTRDAADGLTCTWEQRHPGDETSDTCRGAFRWRDDAWHYPVPPDTDGSPPAAEVPSCAASGSPGPAAVFAARRNAYPSLGCVRFPGEGGWACPPAAAVVDRVRCDRRDRAAPFACSYSMRVGNRPFACKADLRPVGTGWTITGGVSRDGRFSFDEACR